MESQMAANLRWTLADEGYRPRILSIRINKPPVKDPDVSYVRGIISGPLAIRKPYYALELLVRIEQEIRRGIDIVHFMWVGFPYLTQWIIRRLRSKQIKTIYTVLSSTSPPGRYRGVNLLVVQSEESYYRYQRTGFFKNRISLIRPPVDKSRLKSSNQPPGAYFVCASGPFTEAQLEQRGVRLLFKAFARLKAANISVRLRYFGRWNRGHHLIERIAREYNADNIEVKTGYCNDLPTIICGSSGVIIPYIGTGDAPLSAIEALCCGRPVVITRGPGLANEIEKEGAGIVVNPSANEIFNAVVKILAAQEAYGRNALNMSHRFGTDYFREGHLTLYRELCESGSKR
jgi:glycosyltransferase involved in cell wall biosynthesis